MGIRNYIVAPTAAEQEAEEAKRASKRLSRMSRMSLPPPPLPPIDDEKRVAPTVNAADLQAPLPEFPPGFVPRPDSVMTGFNGSTTMVDELKHEVMVNYLYQQQCAQLWVGDDTGELEGVLLCKARGQYMACPPQLGISPFAIACAALGVQVRHTSELQINPKLTIS